MLIDVDKFTVENYIGRKKEKKEKGRFEKNIDTHLKRFFSPTEEGKKKQTKQNTHRGRVNVSIIMTRLMQYGRQMRNGRVRHI